MVKKKILIIDDEEDIAKTVSFRLSSLGYEVIAANNGLEGLEKAQREKPNLILLDVMMPKMDGFEVLRRLKDDPETKYTPVIMLTCRGESGSLFKAQDLGSVDYVIKPFESQELLDLIERYI